MEIQNRISLEDDFTSEILEIIERTRDFQKQVQEAKERIDKLNRAKIIVDNRDAIKNISETRKQINDIKKNVSVVIAAKNSATESIKKIKGEAKMLVSRPFTAIFKAKDEISGILKSITDKVFNLKTIAAGIVLGGTAKVAFDNTIGSAARLEQEQVSMQHFIGYSKPNAGKQEIQKITNDFLVQLRKNANETPFGTNEVLEAGRRAINVSTGDTGQAMELVKLAEDMASLNPGKSVMDAMEALADLKTGEAERMKEFGFKLGADDFVKASGSKTAKNATQLSDNDFATAYRSIVNNKVAPIFKGGADELSKTTAGQWSTTTGNIESILSNIGATALPSINRMLIPINEALDRLANSKAFANLQKDLSDFAGKQADKAVNFINGIISNPEKISDYKKKFDEFKSSLKEVKDAMVELGHVGKTVYDALKPLLEFIVAHPKLLEGFFAAKIGGSLLKGGFDSFKNAKEILKEFPKLESALKTMVKNGGGGLKGVLKLPFTGLKEGFSFVKGIAKWVPGVFSITGKNIVSTFKGGQSTIKSFFGLFPKGAKSAISAFNTLKSTLKGFSLIKPLQEAFAGFKNLGVMKELPKALSAAFSPLKTVFSTLGNVIKTFSSGAVKALRTFFTIIAANPVVAIIIGIIAIVVLLYEAWTHNWGGIRDKTHEVIEFVKSKVSSVKDTFNNIKAELNTFVDDCGKAWERLKEFFKNPITAIVKFVKEGNSTFENDPSKKNALGTSYFEGGWTWVGEHGPELMKLPTGAQIKSNFASMKAVKSFMQPLQGQKLAPLLNRESSKLNINVKEGNSKQSPDINIAKLADQIVIREDADIDKITDALAKKILKVHLNMA